MEFLRSFLRRHLAVKPVVASPNVSCFFRLIRLVFITTSHFIVIFTITIIIVVVVVVIIIT